MPSQNVLRIAYFGVSGKSEGPVHSTGLPGYSLQSLIGCTQATRAIIPKDRHFALLNLANDLDSQNMSAVPA
jgi:hypothetical protein